MVEEGRLYLIHFHLDLCLSLTVLTYSKDVIKEALSGTVITDTGYYLGIMGCHCGHSYSVGGSLYMLTV